VLRVAASLATVLVMYSAYRLLAVPWIEPAAGRYRSDAQLEFGPPRDRLAGLQRLFAPGDWELDDQTVILESDRVKLLWKDLTDLGGGEVELVPFTMIFIPGASREYPAATEAERLRAAYILQAPKGALLTFNPPADLRRGEIGRLQTGQLRGRITIRSLGKSPGPEDDLVLVTEDVELTEKRLWTPHQVAFTWGRSSGRGEQLEVTFRPGQRADDANKHGMNIGGVDAVKLSRLQQLHLDLGSTHSLFGKPKSPTPQRRGPSEARLVEVACRGPVVFDPGEQALVLRDQVDLLEVHPDGPSDVVSCDALAVFFAQRRNPLSGQKGPASKAAPAKLNSLADLQPQRIEARGNPVTVHAPSQQIEARGDRLQYDLETDRVVLDATQEAFLRRGPDEIRAAHLEYQLGASGRLGEALADGPGWLRVQVPGRNAEALAARWDRQLRLQPQDDQHLLSLLGDGKVEYGALGTLSADEVFVWLQEVPAREKAPPGISPSDLGLAEGPAGATGPAPGPPPAAAQRTEVIPDRMLARRNVQLDSAKVSGAGGELRVWFQRAPAASEPAPGGKTPWSSALPQPNAPAAPAGPPGPPTPTQHFHVEGSVLKLGLLLTPSGGELGELIVEDNARLTETQTDQPGAQPIRITGDRVHVLDASRPSMAATVTGNLAHVEGRGFALSGPSIHVNCGTNQLRVQGPGRMALPLDRDFQGRPLSGAGSLPADTGVRGPASGARHQGPGARADGRAAQASLSAAPVPLAVLWQHGMTLDGQTARFEESVTASAQGQQIETDLMEVTFSQPIRLADAKSQSRPEVKLIVCRGSVVLKGSEVENGQQVSFQRMEVGELQIDRLTGAVEAAGPGHAVTVRRQTPRLAVAGPPGQPPPEPRIDPAKPLVCLDIRCRGPITGNLHHRELAFSDQVRAIYLPTASWETVPQSDDPVELGPDAIVLHCDRLGAVQMLVAPGGARSWDVQATGNATAEGAGFFARATRMSYEEGKGLLVLDGEPRADAILSVKKGSGDRHEEYRARQILYWPKTGQWKSSVRSLDASSLRSLNPARLFGGSGGKP
jgi:hypothetical protein